MTMDKEWKVDEGGLVRTRTCGWSPPGCHPVGCGMFIYTDRDACARAVWRWASSSSIPTA